MSTQVGSIPQGTLSQDETLESVRRYWDEHVHDWKIARHPAGTAEFFQEIEDYRYEKLSYLPQLVKFDAYVGKRVLDVGCGVGNDLSRFARAGALCTGVDLAPRAIQLARANFSQRGLSGDFAVMNGEQLDLPDNSFDLVFCHTVLQFTPHPEGMVREIHRVLRPGAETIVMMINRKSWMNALRHLMKVEVDHLDAPVYRRLTLGEFREMLSPFSQVKIVPERFPVATKVHSGMKAWLFNVLFVGGFNRLPRPWTRPLGHHLVAFCRKKSS
jgi:2-polyprenyl-3-methyl-5-hydroxy-6-metoxy-1,4-benzoquinol methylase